jgi:hypothetical protein
MGDLKSLTYPKVTVFHGLFRLNGVSSCNHLHKCMALIFVDDAGLYLAMAAEN